MGKGNKKGKREEQPWSKEKCRGCGRHHCRCKTERVTTYTSTPTVTSPSSSSSTCSTGSCPVVLHKPAGQNSDSNAIQILNKSGVVCANGVCRVTSSQDNSSGLDRQRYTGNNGNSSSEQTHVDPKYIVKAGQSSCSSCGNAHHNTGSHNQPAVVPYEKAIIPPNAGFW